MDKKPKKQQKPKAAKKKRDPRAFDSASPLSIAKSIAARFGEEIQEDEFFDEPAAEVKVKTVSQA
jgi:hypothetical protein